MGTHGSARIKLGAPPLDAEASRILCRLMHWRDILPGLIHEGSFRTQEELARAIGERCEEWPNQATISRELSAIDARKVAGVYQLPPPAVQGVPIHAVVATAGGSLAVVRTEPAFANVLARRIDRAAIEGILGTIAGDDTVFVALAGPSILPSLRAVLGL